MAGKLVTLASYWSFEEAHLAKNHLEATGIRAVLDGETTVNMFGLLGNAVGGIKLQVDEADVQRAALALEEPPVDEGLEPSTEDEPAESVSPAATSEGDEDGEGQEGDADATEVALDTARFMGKRVIWVFFMGLSLFVMVLVAARMLSSIADRLFQ